MNRYKDPDQFIPFYEARARQSFDRWDVLEFLNKAKLVVDLDTTDNQKRQQQAIEAVKKMIEENIYLNSLRPLMEMKNTAEYSPDNQWIELPKGTKRVTVEL